MAKGSVPYLAAKADEYDPATAWKSSITVSRVSSAYPSIGTLRSVQVVARDGNGRWGGRVRTLRLHGSKKSMNISGDKARSVFGLRSTWFTAG
jgi:peptidoglycan hydrolase-like amidase